MTAQEMRAAEWAKVQQYEADARAAQKADPKAAAASVALVVHRHHTPRRFQHNLIVAGPADAVRLYVGHVLGTDGCVPHYEHMLWTVREVVEQNGLVMAELMRSSYAGD